MKKLYRSQTDKVLFGICGGIADYFSVDPVAVRAAAVVLAVFSAGAFVLAYILCLFIIPLGPKQN